VIAVRVLDDAHMTWVCSDYVPHIQPYHERRARSQ
jgi:hypothetical protein